MANLRFCTLNYRGLGDLQKRDLLKQCLINNKVDMFPAGNIVIL